MANIFFKKGIGRRIAISKYFIYFQENLVCISVGSHKSQVIQNYGCCLSSAQVTLSHLAAMKQVYKPKIAISENVVRGNIGQRIVESLEGFMESKARAFR